MTSDTYVESSGHTSKGDLPHIGIFLAKSGMSPFLLPVSFGMAVTSRAGAGRDGQKRL